MQSDDHHKDDDIDNIPTLTQEIPELTDVVEFAEEEIPELTDVVEFSEDSIPELTDVVEATEDNIPELTEVVDDAEDFIPELTDVVDEDIQEQNEAEAETAEPVAMSIPAFQHSISMSNVSDNELELQQWQIEQQAIAQRSDWQALGQMASVSSSENINEQPSAAEPNQPESTTTEAVKLTNDQQRILDASWQRLEAFLMEQMPPEIAGTYLSVIEQQIQQSRAQISRDLTLLDEDSIESLLDFYQIDRGF